MPEEIIRKYLRCSICRAEYSANDATSAESCEARGRPNYLIPGSLLWAKEFPAAARPGTNLCLVLDVIYEHQTHKVIYYRVCAAGKYYAGGHPHLGCAKDFYLTEKQVLVLPQEMHNKLLQLLQDKAATESWDVRDLQLAKELGEFVTTEKSKSSNTAPATPLPAPLEGE